MKDYKIYIFTTDHKEGDFTISQVYALSFYIAWDLIVHCNKDYEFIDFVGFEYTTMPCEWDYLDNSIALTN